MGSLLAKFLAGGAAGLLAWAMLEPFAPKDLGNPRWESWEGNLILLFGALVGFTVGGLDGFTRGGKVHLLRGMGLGWAFGVVGVMLGSSLGASLAYGLFGRGVFGVGGALPVQIMARTVLFAPMGLFLGGAIGGSSLTVKRAIQGAIGGAIGGAISGFSFDLVGATLAPTILKLQGQHVGEVGGPSRAITFTIMGAAIALFIGLVERFSRSAWLRLSLGRNEGKEWSIDSAQTFIGRSEGASVPLFGDVNVAPIHASIQKHGGQYILTDGGSPIGTYLNGQRIQQAPLVHGSVIQIASFPLQFLMKGSAAPIVGPEAYRGQSYPAGPYGAATQAAAPVGAVGGMPFGAQQNPYPQAPVSNQTVAYGAGAYPQQQTHQPVASASFAVVALDGSVAGQRFPIQSPMEVGREGAGIRIATDTNASRRHASISPSFSGVQVSDLGSTNGTFVNGQRVQTAEAKPGDVIKIGGTSFRVEQG